MWPVLRVATVPILLSPPSIPGIPLLISLTMVNYHDPVVVAQDYCASTFAAKQASSLSLLTSFDSGTIEALACLGWTLLVCLPCRSSTLLLYRIESSGVSSTAGSFSLLSITSGMSSEGIAPSVGRYGSVAIARFLLGFFARR